MKAQEDKTACLHEILKNGHSDMGMTIAEKILARKNGRETVRAGDILEVAPDIVMSHYMTYYIIDVIKRLNVHNLWNKDRIRILLDHHCPPKKKEHANHEKIARDFARQHGIKCYDINEGIAHVVLLENGEIAPGMLAVGTDSHSTIYGCVGALGTGIGYTEAASIWLTGKTWMKVPETFKIFVKGESLPYGVYPKDLILAIIGELTANGCTYKSVEFYGDVINRMDMSGRMTLSCMSMEMGVKSSIFPVDDVTVAYLRNRISEDLEGIQADEGAEYAKVLSFEVDTLEPMISIPHRVDNLTPVSSVGSIPIHQAFVGSCANGSKDDLETVARILKDRKIASGVRFIVTPASKEVLKEIIKSGAAYQIIESGAMITNPDCGACAGDVGSLGDGEICLSSATRNFVARMGNPNSEIYLASPATVAASAIRGEITDPREFL